MTAPILPTLLGNHAITQPIKDGTIASDQLALDFADVQVPNTAFKRVVRDLEFDVAELAIVTFLMARAQGVPLSLLPAVVTARFQHPFLWHNRAREELTPQDLNGKRIAIRSYTVTTVAWIQDLLARDYGVDLGTIQWVTFEDAHVAGFTDPPGVMRADGKKSMAQMLDDGEVDAVISPSVPDDANIHPVIADPKGAAQRWHDTYGAIQVNHMIVVKTELLERNPSIVKTLWQMLAQCKERHEKPAPGTPDMTPFGIEANRRNLEVAINATHARGLIPERIAVDDLFNDVTRSFI